MKEHTRLVAWRSVVYASCAVLALWLSGPLEASEFSGGSITGPLLRMKSIAVALFLVATIVGIWLPRFAGAAVCAACLLAWPLDFCMLAPGPCRQVLGGVWSVPLVHKWNLNTLWTVQFSLTILAAWVGVTAVMQQSKPR